MPIEAIGASHDMGRLSIPDEVMLPIRARDWDADWTHAGRTEIRHIRCVFGEAGHDWKRLCAAVGTLNESGR